MKGRQTGHAKQVCTILLIKVEIEVVHVWYHLEGNNVEILNQ